MASLGIRLFYSAVFIFMDNRNPSNSADSAPPSAAPSDAPQATAPAATKPPSIWEDLRRVGGIWILLLAATAGALWWIGQSGSRILADLAYTSPNSYSLAEVYRAEGISQWRQCLERVNSLRGGRERLESAAGVLRGDALRKRAESNLLQARRLYPNFLDVPDMLADLSLWDGRTTDSYVWNGEGLALRARDDAARGQAAEGKKEWEAALAAFEVALRMGDPSDRSAEGKLECLLRLDRMDEAGAFEARLESEKRLHSARALRLAAECQGRRGNRTAQEDLLRQALRRDPLDIETIRALGDFLVARGRKQDAFDLYKSAIDRITNDANLYHRQAKLALDLSRPRDAVHYYKEAIRVHPNNALLQYQLGQTYLQLGDSIRAQPYLRRAMELDPSLFRAKPGE